MHLKWDIESRTTSIDLESLKTKLRSQAQDLEDTKSMHNWEILSILYTWAIPKWYSLKAFGRRDGKQYYFEIQDWKATSVCLNMAPETWDTLEKRYWNKVIRPMIEI